MNPGNGLFQYDIGGKIGSGGWNRTNDLQVMSLTSYLCSTPQHRMIQTEFVMNLYSLFSVRRGTLISFFELASLFCEKKDEIKYEPIAFTE